MMKILIIVVLLVIS
ncbi:hypothetical protein MLW24_24990 [Escherichia coli]|nr:hypothetical protein [Escherichia coli]MCN7649292.1 hypothetical protein [Escherichia coli]